jgi:uncharacterized protein YlxW (UPF0749 family)
MFNSFFSSLLIWFAIAALCIGSITYIVSYFVGYIPMLKAHAAILRALSLVFIILGGYYVADNNGYKRRIAEDQTEIERLNSEARAKEVILNNTIKKNKEELKRAKDEIKANQSSMDARVDSGELRFPSTCSLQTNSSTSSGDTTDGAESARQATKDIIGIVSDGDKAIVKLNSCIKQYNEIMTTVNEGVK